jgi:hypothetical protein
MELNSQSSVFPEIDFGAVYLPFSSATPRRPICPRSRGRRVLVEEGGFSEKTERKQLY